MDTLSGLGIFQKLKGRQKVRICAFGSSNTERFDTGMHWFDFLHLGFVLNYGASFCHALNAGVSGNTSTQMLERIEEDIAPYRPDLTIITCGGNDSCPGRNISEACFRDNLLKMHERLSRFGEVLFQTYYACDLEKFDQPGYAVAFPRYMQIIRDCAAQVQAPLIDHYTRWDRLRKYSMPHYRLLMRDSMHLNRYGNMVMGLDLLRRFGFELSADKMDYCREGLMTQCVLDLLEKQALPVG